MAIASESRVAAVRSFTRFYTQRMGVLRDGLLGSRFTLTEARILYELAQQDGLSARQLCAILDLDPGYASRLLAAFEQRGLLTRRPSPMDRRSSLITLTAKGQRAFAPLDRRSREQVSRLLAPLSDPAQRTLAAAMKTVERILSPQREASPGVVLRPPRPGDLGWVIGRHGALYAQEYGWDASFEVLVARIVTEFSERFDPEREACWIAEHGARNVGSIFLVRQSDEVAKLRMLIVEPDARGLGVGGKLVGECISFARSKGYAKITLWTNSILHAARALYERNGFVHTASEPHHSFGHDLIGETWELTL